MVNKLSRFYKVTIIAMVCIVAACSSSKNKHGKTLADIDTSANQYRAEIKENKANTEKSADEVKDAYRRYLESVTLKGSSRKKALTRLAELELQFSHALIDQAGDGEVERSTYVGAVNRTITLLQSRLQDYPDASDNDRVLYQLAQAFDKIGRYQDSMDALANLSQRYPQSDYYSEAQFRLGEAAFARGDYITAEDAYSEVIFTPGNDNFYDKALFKRGWSRYKQQLYDEAIADYIKAFDQHSYDETNAPVAEGLAKNQYDEFFRALGLAFSQMRQRGEIERQLNSYPAFKKRYQYRIYQSTSEVFAEQERYSDAVGIYRQFIEYNAQSSEALLSELAILDTWKQGGFTKRLTHDFEDFYLRYQPSTKQWQTIADNTVKQAVFQSIRQYTVEFSAYTHSLYQRKQNQVNFSAAETWYTRYLNHFQAYANKDGIYNLYAELLLEQGKTSEALSYFILAAYDKELVLNKSAAFATITLTRELFEQQTHAQEKMTLLDQHLLYATRYLELYPQDEKATNIAISAAQIAFNASRYAQSVELVNFVSDNNDSQTLFTANTIKAKSYLELKQYADAENVFSALLQGGYKANKKTTTELSDGLALAIFRQGEAARDAKNVEQALLQFIRVQSRVGHSALAATGIYEAIAIATQHERWGDVVSLIDNFRNHYPNDKRNETLRKTLSVAYLNSNQTGKAAQELEQIANLEQNIEVKRAALWKAAALYEDKGNIDGALRNYRSYAHNYPKPFGQQMEAFYKLTVLYQQQGDATKRYFWQEKIRNANHKALKTDKNERTQYITSSTLLDMAHQQHQRFDKQKLVEPIARNLKRKKAAMKEAVALYGQASSFGIAEITTESTHAIGEIYRIFSQSLLESERPKNLSAMELEQYEILLEDQAFPFEEKAIEFYERNMSRTQDNTYNQWIGESLTQLRALFPARYDRANMLKAYHE